MLFEWFAKALDVWLESMGRQVVIFGPQEPERFQSTERAVLKMIRTRAFYFLAAMLVVAAGVRADSDAKSKFLRFVDLGNETGSLKTSIVTYRDKNGVEVSLVSAVHVGDKKYYDDLQADFSRYDSLLYEMIKPKEVEPSERGKEGGGSIISVFQRGMKNALGLEFQLDGVDYSRPNFVHADMDPETFFRLQKKKGEGFISMMLKSMQAEMKRQQESKVKPPSIFDLIKAFTSEDSARSLKYLFARQMEGMEDIMAGFEGDGESVIVGERNKVAIEVLKKEMKLGRKKLGIFYGAAHMPDMEERLVKELGFAQVGKERWLIAWDIRKKSSQGKPGKNSEAKSRRIRL